MKRVTDPDLIDKILAGDEGDAPVRGGLSADFPYRTGPPEPVGVGGPSGGFHPDYEPMYSAFDIIQGRGAPPGRRNMPDYRAANAFAQGITARQAGTNLGAPPNLYMEAAESGLHAAGMAPGIAGMAGAAGLAIPGWLAGAAALGAYEGMAPAESPLERLKNVGLGAGTGLALAGLHKVPGMGRLTGNIGGRLAADTGVFGGLHAGQAALAGEDVDLLRSLVHGGAAAVAFTGMGAGGAGVDPRRMPDRVRPLLPPEMGVRRAAVPPEAAKRVLSSKLDAELPRPAERPQIAPESTQIPADAVGGKPKIVAEPAREGRAAGAQQDPTSFEALRKAAEQPIAGSKLSESIQPYRFEHKNIETFIEHQRSTPMAGELPPGRIEAIAKEVAAEGKVKGRDVATEVERRGLKESLPEDFTTFVDMAGERASARREKQGRRPVFPWSRNVERPAPIESPPKRIEGIDEPRLLQGFGDGIVGHDNPISKNLVYPKQEVMMGAMEARQRIATEDMHPVADKFNAKEGGFLDMNVGKIIEGAREMPGVKEMPREQWLEVGPGVVREWASSPDGAKILKGAKTRAEAEALADYAVESLSVWDQGWTRMSGANVAHGRSEAGYRAGHFPKYYDKPGALNLKEKFKESYREKEGIKVYEKGAAGTRKTMTRELFRSDEESGRPRDWSQRRAFDRWSTELAHKVFYEPGLANDYAHARYMDLAGLPQAAEAIRKYSQSDYNNTRFGFMSGIDRMTSQGGVPNVAADAFWFARRRLADSVFTWNLAWNLGIQPTSMALTATKSANHPEAMFKGVMKTYASREFRNLMNERSFVRAVKGGKGTIAKQGQQESLIEGRTRSGTKEFLDEAAQTPNKLLEKELDLMSAAIGYEVGKAQGLKGRALMDFSSDFAMKTQSVYSKQQRAEILRSKSFATAVPFSGFTIETKNLLSEAMGRRGYGEYSQGSSKAAKARAAMMAALAMGLASEWSEQFGREAYGPSVVPGLGLLRGTREVFPVSVYKNLQKIGDYLSAGRVDRTAGQIARTSVRGGMPIYNAMKAIELNSGTREHPGGAYYLPDNQFWLAVALGDKNTQAGRKYYDKQGGWKQIYVPAHRKKDDDGGDGGYWEDQ